MKILLDTHILIWFHAQREKLSSKIIAIINDIENEIYFSSINVWETEVKHLLHPDSLTLSGKELLDLSIRSGMTCLYVKPEHALLLSMLRYAEYAPKPHKDPFDRMLICQAKSESMKLMTHDALLPYYNETCVLYV